MVLWLDWAQYKCSNWYPLLLGRVGRQLSINSSILENIQVNNAWLLFLFVILCVVVWRFETLLACSFLPWSSHHSNITKLVKNQFCFSSVIYVWIQQLCFLFWTVLLTVLKTFFTWGSWREWVLSLMSLMKRNLSNKVHFFAELYHAIF